MFVVCLGLFVAQYLRKCEPRERRQRVITAQFVSGYLVRKGKDVSKEIRLRKNGGKLKEGCGDVHRIVALEQSMGEMQKQMSKLSVLVDRLEQRLSLIEEAEEKGSGKTITQPIQQRNQPMTRPLKIPLFDGDNAESWLLRVEHYFELSDFTEEQKLEAVRTCFTGEALFWYRRWERGENPVQSWAQMKYWVLEQFSSSFDTKAGERLLTLRQEGTVKQYCKDFISLAINAPELPENVLEMVFMVGLKPRIRAGVKLFEPTTLNKMMTVATRVENWTDHLDAPPGSRATGDRFSY